MSNKKQMTVGELRKMLSDYEDGEQIRILTSIRELIVLISRPVKVMKLDSNESDDGIVICCNSEGYIDGEIG